MITPSDSFNTFDLGRYYAILPPTPMFKTEDYITHFKAKQVPQGFHYTSDKNDQWENVESLRKLIKEYVDPNFSV